MSRPLKDLKYHRSAAAIPGTTADVRAIADRLVPTLYEDQALLAVQKPAGLVFTGEDPSCPMGLTEILTIRGNGIAACEKANALTRDDSGVLLIGKDGKIARLISQAIRAGNVSQDYLAVVLGRPAGRVVRIDSTHGASRGRRLSKRPAEAARGHRDSRPVGRTVGATRRPPGPNTTVRLIRTSGRRSLVRIQTTIYTTHALRAQMRAVGLRIVGDQVNAGKGRRQPRNPLCLHLERISFNHPYLGKTLCLSSPAPRWVALALDGRRDFERPLTTALARRLGLIGEGVTDCCRLLSGPVEGLPELVAEKFGPFVVLQLRADTDKTHQIALDAAAWYRRTLRCEAVYAKPFPRSRESSDTQSQRVLRSTTLLVGRAMPPEVAVSEHGLRFLVKPCDGHSVGLYLDHRENRRRVRALAAGADVLNLFAYTCGFSVAAAAGGAASVTSVDIAPKSLEWGKANFALNGFDPGTCRFVQADAMQFLGSARRTNKSYDVILLDPPTFAHGRGRRRFFSVETDLEAIITAAVAVLRPGGIIMVSTNSRGVAVPELRAWVAGAVAGRRHRMISTPPLPADFAMDPDHAKTVFVRIQ